MTGDSPLARWLTPLRRWWYVVLAMVVLGVAAAVITMPEGPRDPGVEDPDATYRATHLLIRNQASTEPINFGLVELLAQQGDMIVRVVDRMDERVSTGDVQDVELVTDPSLGTISVTAEQASPDLAAEFATTYAEVLGEIIDERASVALRQSLERVSERLPDLQEQVEDLQAEASGFAEDDLERQVVEAELEQAIAEYTAAQSEARGYETRIEELETQFETLQEPVPVSTSADGTVLGIPASPVLRVIVLGLLGLLVGAAMALLIDYLDTRIRTREDAEQAFGLPVIAELPPRTKRHRDAAPLPVVTDPTGITAEAFRSLRLSLVLAPGWRLSGSAPTHEGSVGTVAPIERNGAPVALLVTSALTGDGKSTTTANLAATFAESGASVLVVDCDFRRPAVGELLGVSAGKGLQDLTEPRASDLEALTVPTSVNGVTMIRTGEVGIAPSWFATQTHDFVDRLRDLADVVIFDTGPITHTNEASALVPSIDAVLLVNRAGRLSRSQARNTVEQLSRIGAAVAGVVMVGTNGARRYGYYSPYTPPTEKRGRRPGKHARTEGASKGWP